MKKILIFDNDESIRMLYELELSEEGYDVITSAEIARCMELIREHRPNVVVMDRKMGNHDGLDVLKEIRGQFRALPLVLCTAYPFYNSEENPKIVDFRVTKTSNLKDLKEKINAALSLPRC